MVTGKKYKYGSALWRIMLLAQMGMMQVVCANPGDGAVAALPLPGTHMMPSIDAAMAAKSAMMNASVPDMSALKAAHQEKFKSVLAGIPEAAAAMHAQIEKKARDSFMNTMSTKVFPSMKIAAEKMQEELALPSSLPQDLKYDLRDVRVERAGPHTLLFYVLNEKAVVESKTFSAGKHDQVIVRGDAKSILLQKVTGVQPSIIQGMLDVRNGHMWLSNTNGIVLDGKINGNFLATTLDISPEDFRAGHYTFKGDGESSIHSKIVLGSNLRVAKPGEYLAVLASHIEGASGLMLVAPLSKVFLQAAQKAKAVIDLEGDGFLGFVVDERASRNLSLQLADKSTIEAGYVFLSAQDVADTLASVVNTGNLKAVRVAEDPKTGIIHVEGGDNSTVNVTGNLTASEGQILATGDTLNVRKGAKLDVSGPAGDGELVVGGVSPYTHTSKSKLAAKLGRKLQKAFHKKGFKLPDIAYASPAAKALRLAKVVNIEEGSVLDASATVEGDGGTVHQWADKELNVYGKTLVRGGPEGGDGGFLEQSSGENKMDIERSVHDLSAPKGESGFYRLDPATITIAAGNANAVAGGAWNYGYDTLTAALGAGNVSLSTVANAGTLPANQGSIIIQVPLTLPAVANTNSLSFTAAERIEVQGPVITGVAPPPGGLVGPGQGDHAVSFQGADIEFQGPIQLGTKSFTANATQRDISIMAGLNAGAGGANLTAAGAISLNGPIVANGGVITLNSNMEVYNYAQNYLQAINGGRIQAYYSGVGYITLAGVGGGPTAVPGSNVPPQFQQILVDANRFLSNNYGNVGMNSNNFVVFTFPPSATPQFVPAFGPQFGPVAPPPPGGPGLQGGPVSQGGPAPQGGPAAQGGPLVPGQPRVALVMQPGSMGGAPASGGGGGQSSGMLVVFNEVNGVTTITQVIPLSSMPDPAVLQGLVDNIAAAGGGGGAPAVTV